MIERSSEELPERSVSTGVVGREQQRKHVDQPESAGNPNPNSKYERQPDRQLTVCNEESDRCRMRQHKLLQHWDHERIGLPILQEPIDPRLESAMQRELGAKDLVLAEDEE